MQPRYLKSAYSSNLISDRYLLDLNIHSNGEKFEGINLNLF